MKVEITNGYALVWATICFAYGFLQIRLTDGNWSGHLILFRVVPFALLDFIFAMISSYCISDGYYLLIFFLYPPVIPAIHFGMKYTFFRIFVEKPLPGVFTKTLYSSLVLYALIFGAFLIT